jgi:hypothetical protein
VLRDSRRGERRFRRSPRFALWLGLLLAGGLACGEAAEPPRLEGPAQDGGAAAEAGRGYEIPRLPPDRLRLSGSAEGLDGLLRTVERALAERDSTRLQELLVTSAEFRDILFPSFPAAHPPINADFETVWLLQSGDSQRGLRQLLHEYGGRRVRILAVRFEKPGQDFVNFVLDETSRVDIEVEGIPKTEVKLFGSVFHVGDRYKVLTYPDD